MASTRGHWTRIPLIGDVEGVVLLLPDEPFTAENWDQFMRSLEGDARGTRRIPTGRGHLREGRETMSAAVVWWCPVCEDVIEAGIELYGDAHVFSDSEHHGVVRAVRETELNGDTHTYVPKDWSTIFAAAEQRGRRWAIDTLREAANHEKYDSVAERWIDHAADYLEAMATEEAT